MFKRIIYILAAVVLGFGSIAVHALPAVTDWQWMPVRFGKIGANEVITVPAFTELKGIEVRSQFPSYNVRLDPFSLELRGRELRAVFFSYPNSDDIPWPRSRGFLDLPPLPPGTYDLVLAVSYDATMDNDRRVLRVEGPPASRNVYPLGLFDLPNSPPPDPSQPLPYRQKQYLAIGEAEAQRLLDAQLIKPVNPYSPALWIQSEAPFLAWPATGDAPSTAVPVCRLFHPGAVTHFYSANATDCATLRRTAPWVDEGIAFRALLPTAAGTCGIGTQIVYRLFSESLGTHRYTRSPATYEALQSKGWRPEGAVFCSPTG
jgi:hypothetical protein